MFVGLKLVFNLFNFEFIFGNDIGVNVFLLDFFLFVRFFVLNRLDNVVFYGFKLQLEIYIDFEYVMWKFLEGCFKLLRKLNW